MDGAWSGKQCGDGAWKGGPQRGRGLGKGTVETEPVGKGAELRQGRGELLKSGQA